MYFSEPRAHAMPFFIFSKILPLQMLYAEKVSSIMEKSISIMEQRTIVLKCPLSYKKWQILHPRLNALTIQW